MNNLHIQKHNEKFYGGGAFTIKIVQLCTCLYSTIYISKYIQETGKTYLSTDEN